MPNVLINIPGSGQRTGTRDGGINPESDSIYVVDAFSSSQGNCKISCESDPKCVSITFYNGKTSYGRCVKNYGSTIRVIQLDAKSGVSSCQPCP